MLEIFTGSKCELSNIEDIIERVQQLLRGKRYLIVLDDVWNNNRSNWISLKNSMQRLGGYIGSMVIVTTRNKDVANAAETRYMHLIKGLSDEESWAFFMQKAFPKDKPENYSGFEEIGRRIVKKCKGLPLAIGVLGGLLRTKHDISEWEFIEKRKMWNLPQETNDILPSLLLSFNYLSSSHLKQCFAYCAIFPKDALIDREDLINLWNAQGFLQPRSEVSNQSPEEVGGKYFDILLNNSLIQAETRHSFVGEVTEYRMHELVHDLALYVSKRDWLIWKGLEKTSDPSGRHLAVFLDDDVAASEFPIEQLKQLRTLHSRTNLFPCGFLMHTKNLRVLKLVAVGLREVPNSIGWLSHLRYLDLSHNPICMLPDSITKLYHLQTFRLFGKKLKDLPERLCKLINLRHIHLMTRSWHLPQGLQNLTSLQSLPMLELHNGRGWSIAELGALKEIKGLLSISGLEHVKSKEDAQRAGIRYKVGISELQLTWNSGWANTHLDVLDAFQPHENLKSLVITGYDSPSFPPWMMSMMFISRPTGTLRPLYNLVRIEFLYCNMCNLLPPLGHLPCLRELSMHSMWSVEHIGDEFYYFSAQAIESAEVYFPALRMLNISYFETLKEWTPPSSSVSAFPLLETLRFECCDKLVSTPTYFPSLKYLWVHKSLHDLPLYNIIRDSNKSFISLEIDDSPELFRLPNELIECKSLKNLRINFCANLQSVPCLAGGACFKKLSICNCSNIEEIPDLSQLIHLEEVEISKCRKLRCLPRGLQTLPRLSSLSVGGFESLQLDDSLSSARSQPLFPALKFLRIIDHDSDEEVPEWVGGITFLEKLELKWCKNLKYLPSKEAMLQLTRLTALIIRSCPFLQETCAKGNGPEWDKISHIKFIRVNSETIQELSSTTI